MEQGSRQGQQSNDAQQNECGSRRQEFIERVSCVHRRIRHRGAGSRQDARNIRRGQAGKSRQSFAAARPFADTDQSQGEQCTQFDSDTRTDEALLDRVTHEKYATEREGNAADPRPNAYRTALQSRSPTAVAVWQARASAGRTEVAAAVAMVEEEEPLPGP